MRVRATALRPREGVEALDVLDERAVREAIDRCDAVVHLASARALSDPDEAARARTLIVQGTSHVVEASRRRGVKVVLAGSAEEYGPDAPVPYHEDGPCAPASAYGKAKHRSVRDALTRYREGVVALRPSTVYGPGQRPLMLVAQCIRAALEDSVVRLNGGDQRRDHVFVDDVADAFARAIEAHERSAGHAINIASGESHSVRSIAERIIAIAGRGRIELGPPSHRPGDVREMRFDTTRARESLRWRATTPLDVGLERTVRAALGP